MSRYRLNWFNLTQSAGQDLCLKIPICEIYGPIVDRAFPGIEHIGWRQGTVGTGYTYIKHISPENHDGLIDFLQLLREIVCLRRTTHLDGHFAEELDENYALDYNFQPDTFPLVYSEVGELEHRAKEAEDAASIARLVDRLAEVVRRHPTLARAEVIVAMPPRPSKTFHLPVCLVDGLVDVLSGLTKITVSKKEHPKLRALSIGEKISTLSDVFMGGKDVREKSAIIVDDLHQSGASLWSLAKHLKSRGASEVFALSCVKSWRDTDNI